MALRELDHSPSWNNKSQFRSTLAIRAERKEGMRSERDLRGTANSHSDSTFKRSTKCITTSLHSDCTA